MNLHDKVAIVTGGTRGIGFAISDALSREVAGVMICGRSHQGVELAVEKLNRCKRSQVVGMVCDIRDHDQVKKMVDTTVKTFGGLDILINNAGVVNLGGVGELAVDEWCEVVDTNLTGTFYCCREAIPMMKKRGGGYIVNMCSRAGINAYAGGAAYNASKFGMIGLSEALLQDVRGDHIRVSYIMPGRVNTEFGGEKGESWQLSSGDIAKVVTDLLGHENRAVVSRVEIRPSEPPPY